MNKELIEEIQKLGLNSYEAKVYLALLERASLSVSEVSKLSKVPRTRVYDVLNDLVTNGLASLKPGKYKKYSAADFDVFKEKLVRQIDKQGLERKNAIEKVTLTLKRKLESIYPPLNQISDPIDYIEIIKDSYQIHKKFMQLCGEAKEEILIFDKPPYTGPDDQLEDQTNQQSELIRKGTIIKCIYQLAVHEEERRWQFQEIDLAIKHGEQARVIKELPTKMAVFDERIVVTFLEDPTLEKTSLTAIVIEHRSLAKTLKTAFETYWERAEDYHAFIKKENLIRKG